MTLFNSKNTLVATLFVPVYLVFYAQNAQAQCVTSGSNVACTGTVTDGSLRGNTIEGFYSPTDVSIFTNIGTLTSTEPGSAGF